MSELSDIVTTAIPIFAGAHAVSTIGRAYVRYKMTEDIYPTKTAVQRMPRCIAKRVFRLSTLQYSLFLGTAAAATYNILRNI